LRRLKIHSLTGCANIPVNRPSLEVRAIRHQPTTPAACRSPLPEKRRVPELHSPATQPAGRDGDCPPPA